MAVYKAYVEVDARFGRDGSLIPMRVLWEDGRSFDVDRVLDIRKAASLKAGGCGIRYLCRIHGRETYLYFEEDRWFVEARQI